MFKFLRKNKCKHYKKCGEPVPLNMVEIFQFDITSNKVLPFGISECQECGTRAFNCVGLHLIHEDDSKTIDDFIAYKIPKSEFVDFLERNMAWWEEKP